MVRWHPVFGSHPEMESAGFGELDFGGGVGHGSAQAMCQKIRGPHHFQELRIEYPAAVISETLGLHQHFRRWDRNRSQRNKQEGKVSHLNLCGPITYCIDHQCCSLQNTDATWHQQAIEPFAQSQQDQPPVPPHPDRRHCHRVAGVVGREADRQAASDRMPGDQWALSGSNAIKCPGQESNLIFERRGLACNSTTLQGQIVKHPAEESNLVRRFEFCYAIHHTRRVCVSIFWFRARRKGQQLRLRYGALLVEPGRKELNLHTTASKAVGLPLADARISISRRSATSDSNRAACVLNHIVKNQRAPSENRTHLSALKARYPVPIDERAIVCPRLRAEVECAQGEPLRFGTASLSAADWASSMARSLPDQVSVLRGEISCLTDVIAEVVEFRRCASHNKFPVVVAHRGQLPLSFPVEDAGVGWDRAIGAVTEER